MVAKRVASAAVVVGTVVVACSGYGADDGPSPPESSVPEAGGDVGTDASTSEAGGDAGCATPPSGTLDDAVVVTGGQNHTCAIRRDGSLCCWGENTYGQLGVPQSTTLGTTRPQKVVFPPEIGSATITRIGLVFRTSFAVDSELRLWVWGGNSQGLLANGTTDDNPHATPALVQIGGEPLFVQRLAVEAESVCALATTNDIYCWGINFAGQLGPYAGAGDSFVPKKAFQFTKPATPAAVLAPGTGSLGTCYATGNASDGIDCWGETGGGYILTNQAPGAGDNPSAATPLVAAGATLPIADIRYGTNFGCALDANGKLLCWGTNPNFGTMGGSPPDAGSAAPVPGTWGSMATAYITLCAIDDRRIVHCRGDNGQGELGRPTGDAGFDPKMDPVLLSDGGPLAATKIGAGVFHFCAILEGACGAGGPVVCWGENDKGQLGADAGASSNVPVPRRRALSPARRPPSPDGG